MYTFPKLGEFYSTWATDLRNRGVEIRTSHELVQVLSRSQNGIDVSIRRTGSKTDEIIETYDELVLAVLADDAKRLLGSNAGFWEKRILGSAKFFDDITVTHNDVEYMENYYEPRFKEDLALSDVKEDEQNHQIEFAREQFAPMYYTHSYDKDPKRIEMSFDWHFFLLIYHLTSSTNYQPQFPKDLPLERHVFQTILYPFSRTQTDIVLINHILSCGRKTRSVKIK